MDSPFFVPVGRPVVGGADIGATFVGVEGEEASPRLKCFSGAGSWPIFLFFRG